MNSHLLQVATDAPGWLEILSAPSILFGLIAGLIISMTGEALRARRNRPKLRIGEHVPERGDERFSCHAIKIHNTGRTAALGCAGMITLLGVPADAIITVGESILTIREAGLPPRKFNLDEQEEVFLFWGGAYRQINEEFLAWSPLGNPLHIDIYPNSSINLDICRWIKSKKVDIIEDGVSRTITKPSQVHLPSEDGWRRPRAALNVKRKYEFRIDVAGSNARRVSKAFLLDATDDGVEIVDEPRRHRLGRLTKRFGTTRTSKTVSDE
jgi:hypothetical protein